MQRMARVLKVRHAFCTRNETTRAGNQHTNWTELRGTGTFKWCQTSKCNLSNAVNHLNTSCASRRMTTVTRSMQEWVVSSNPMYLKRLKSISCTLGYTTVPWPRFSNSMIAPADRPYWFRTKKIACRRGISVNTARSTYPKATIYIWSGREVSGTSPSL